jgi:hypothetical protein
MKKKKKKKNVYKYAFVKQEFPKRIIFFLILDTLFSTYHKKLLLSKRKKAIHTRKKALNLHTYKEIMKITSSILLVLVTAMTLNVTLAGSSSTTDDHQSTINLLSIRNINAAVVPS